MWSDGLAKSDIWEQYGFNEYELKNGCFGSDGGEGSSAGSGLGGTGEHGWAGDAVYGGSTDPSGSMTGGGASGASGASGEGEGGRFDTEGPEDWGGPPIGGLRDVPDPGAGHYEPAKKEFVGRLFGTDPDFTRMDKFTDETRGLPHFGIDLQGQPDEDEDFGGVPIAGPRDFHGLRRTGMTKEAIREAMKGIAGRAPGLNPYTGGKDSLQAHGIISPGMTDLSGKPSLGFTPTFGWGKMPTGHRAFDRDVFEGAARGKTPEQLGEEFDKAYAGTQDFGSWFGRLFGIQSPLGYTPDKGYYEGTEFTPFDAPVLGAALSFISPPLGALYGLAKGIRNRDALGLGLNLASRLGGNIGALAGLASKGRGIANFFGGPSYDTFGQFR